MAGGGLAAALAMPLSASARSDQADVALVLAIDVFGSVDDSRFARQRKGIAAALESEEVAAAISGGVNQTVEIVVVEWAEEQRPWCLGPSSTGGTTSRPWRPGCGARVGPGCTR